VRKLSDAFEEAQTTTVEWNGLPVHSMVRIDGSLPEVASGSGSNGRIGPVRRA
jgi:hypothetical protein